MTVGTIDSRTAGISANSGGSSGFVPYSGATQNVNLGTHGLTAAFVTVSGNRSIPAWGTTGPSLNVAANNITDTSSTGLVSTAYMNTIQQPTISASNPGVTYTTAGTFVILGAPVAGTNTPTISRPFALIVGAGQTFLGGPTRISATGGFSTVNLSVDGTNAAATFGTTGCVIAMASGTKTDPSTSGTVNIVGVVSYSGGTLAASNSVTGTSVATVLIGSAPAAGSNVTITNAYGLYSQANVRIDGMLGISQSATTKLGVSGSVTAAAWTTAGIGLTFGSATYTDSSSSGTVTQMGVHSLGTATIVASSATTYTIAAQLLVRALTASTNVTITTNCAIYAISGYIGTPGTSGATFYWNAGTTAPSTTATPTFTSYYGGNTKAMGDPVGWLLAQQGATTIKIPYYT